MPFLVKLKRALFLYCLPFPCSVKFHVTFQFYYDYYVKRQLIENLNNKVVGRV